MSRSPLSKHEQPCPPGEAPPVTFGDTPGDSRLRRGFLGLARLPGSGCGTLPGPRDLRLLRLPGAAGSVAARAGTSLHESLGPGSSPSRQSCAVRPLSLCLFVCLFLSVKKKNYPFLWGRGQRPEQWPQAGTVAGAGWLQNRNRRSRCRKPPLGPAQPSLAFGHPLQPPSPLWVAPPWGLCFLSSASHPCVPPGGLAHS